MTVSAPEPRKLQSWQRFAFPYVYAAKVEYNELVNEITLRVIQPGQTAEIHDGVKFVVFTVQQPFTDLFKDKK